MLQIRSLCEIILDSFLGNSTIFFLPLNTPLSFYGYFQIMYERLTASSYSTVVTTCRNLHVKKQISSRDEIVDRYTTTLSK